MSTTIRITDEDKHRLHRVQRRLTDLTGERMTLQRIVGLMAQHAEAEPEHIVARQWRPMDDEEIKALMDEVDSLPGWEGSVEEIDDIVYGEP